MTNRSCGDCMACCHVLGVTQIDKPDFQDCQHLCELGCAIYANRPAICSGYECLYLMDLLPEEGDRPDRLGAVFSVGESNMLGTYFQVAEFCPGAINDPRVQAIVETLAHDYPVMWMQKKKRTLIAAPPERFAEIAAKISELTNKHQKRRHLSIVKGEDC